MFFFYSICGFLLSFGATFFIKRYAISHGIIDDPKQAKRKIHSKPKALLGGVAIWGSVLLLSIFALYRGDIIGDFIGIKQMIGLLIGSTVLTIGGYLDDRFVLRPLQQIVWPVVAVLVVIASGVGIESFTNPFGGQFFLDAFKFEVFTLFDTPYYLSLPADLFTFAWLMGMIYATKFFDGLDGLVSGITIIGALTVFFTSLLPKIYQPETATFALIIAGCFAGFLVHNFYPSTIFLGEAGSTLAGFFIGVLAIIAESKVSTTLVVMALPMLDLIWVISRRVLIEKKSPASADRKHIHHRLLDTGFSHRNAVLVLYVWAIALGGLAWIIQVTGALWLSLIAFIALVSFAFYLVQRAKTHYV